MQLTDLNDFKLWLSGRELHDFLELEMSRFILCLPKSSPNSFNDVNEFVVEWVLIPWKKKEKMLNAKI